MTTISFQPIQQDFVKNSNSESLIPLFLTGKKHLTSSELLKEMEKVSNLKELYELDAGVGERYTVGEHTKMVLKAFENDSGNVEVDKFLESLCLNRSLFAFFLALHDIGKGKAVQENRFRCEERKKKELAYTKNTLIKVCQQFEVEERIVNIFSSLLDHDTIGEYLTEKSTLDATVKRLEASAKKCDVEVTDFLKLHILFHKIDAGSYPFLRSKIFTSDHSNKSLNYCSEYTTKINQLFAQLTPNSSELLELLRQLPNFPLNKDLKRLDEQKADVIQSVFDQEYNTEKVNKLLEVFGLTRYQMHGLLLLHGIFQIRLGKGLLKKEEGLSLKLKFLREVGKNLKLTSGQIKIFYFLIEQFQTIEAYISGKILLPKVRQALVGFATEYQLTTENVFRFIIEFHKIYASTTYNRHFHFTFHETQKTTIRQKKCKRVINYVPSIERNIGALLAVLPEQKFNARKERMHFIQKVKWIHGTNSAALGAISATNNFQLKPTGKLIDENIAPMSGELNRGISIFGVNRNSISCFKINNISGVLDYAKRISNSFNPSELITKFQLEGFEDTDILQYVQETSFNIIHMSGKTMKQSRTQFLEWVRGKTHSEESKKVIPKKVHDFLKQQYRNFTAYFAGSNGIKLLQIRQWDESAFKKLPLKTLREIVRLRKEFVLDMLDGIIKIFDLKGEYEEWPNFLKEMVSGNRLPERYQEIENKLKKCYQLKEARTWLSWPNLAKDILLIKKQKKLRDKEYQKLPELKQRVQETRDKTAKEFAFIEKIFDEKPKLSYQDKPLHRKLTQKTVPIVLGSTTHEAKKGDYLDDCLDEYVVSQTLSFGKQGVNVLFAEDGSLNDIKNLFPQSILSQMKILPLSDLSWVKLFLKQLAPFDSTNNF